MAATYDLIVIGAGWHGLSAAKVYIELHPAEEVLVLEAEATVGGTWSEDRIYPGLKSNNMVDAYESPDFPMSYEKYGVEAGKHIPGAVLHRYLTDYAKKFGVFNRTQFNTDVKSIEALEDGYRVKASVKGKEQVFETKKLVVATGLTSQPNFPQYPGKEDFGGLYFHAKDFHRQAATTKTAQNVTVVGGAKSAYDVAYGYAMDGAHVDMVIRPAGKGPVWIPKPWVLGGNFRLEKLVSVRILTWFSPGPFADADGYSWIKRFLHGTRIGRFITDKFWASLGGEVVEVNGYDKHPEMKKLQPKESAFWTASGLSVLNYDTDWYELVKKGNVTVHEADIEKLSKNTVHLDDGSELEADVLVTATGWSKDPKIKFINFGTAGIGLPHSASEKTALIKETDDKILKLYPKLQQQPKTIAGDFKPDKEPFRLYRFIVPPTRVNKHNIAFAGMVSGVLTANQSNAQALWISAFLDGRLDYIASTPEEVTKEVMLHTQWGKWRYPCGYGASIPDLAFDSQSYIDLLLKDCGINIRRKAGFIANLFHPHEPGDYTGLVDEWVEKHPGKK